jgi:flavin reductase (DIM6/NTAB) family NADH-FMN oxidoreductase RutF
MATHSFRTIEPKILYFGTPVALVSSLNEDGTTNLAPMSSFWALGWTLMLGLLDETKSAENWVASRRSGHARTIQGGQYGSAPIGECRTGSRH